MEFTWITGSVSWFHQILNNDLLGVRPGYGGLAVQPGIPERWQGIEYTRAFRGATYHIVMKRSGKPGIVVDGKAVAGNVLPVLPDGMHEVDVQI